MACWWSADRWLGHVEQVWRRHYLALRPELVARTGGGISLRAVLAVARTHAGAADHRTGRSSRPVVGDSGGQHGITAATGLGARTVSRARTWLLLAGLATEVAPGRHRTYDERMDSWRRGDRARGWAADWALHPSTTHPVDNLGPVATGHTPDGTPPRRGSSWSPTSGSHVVSTGAKTENGRAPRAETSTRRAKQRSGPDPRGLLLATRWRQHPESPRWAHRGTPASWAALLALPARHGWTTRDLIQLLADHATAGGHVLHAPRQPIGYLSWLLSQVNLADRPCALDDAREAAELAAVHQRKTKAQRDLAQARADYHAAAESRRHGTGQQAARTVVTTAAARGRARRDAADRQAAIDLQEAARRTRQSH